MQQSPCNLDTVGVKPLALQWLEADERCPPTGLGRNGQPALTGLYSLPNHCSAEKPDGKEMTLCDCKPTKMSHGVRFDGP